VETHAEINEAIKQHLLFMADDELILAHRDSEWTGHAPILEEDIAFANIAQDELGHASIWYELLEELSGDNPDELVFFRNHGPGGRKNQTGRDLSLSSYKQLDPPIGLGHRRKQSAYTSELELFVAICLPIIFTDTKGRATCRCKLHPFIEPDEG
jgi:hypothetical protein